MSFEGLDCEGYRLPTEAEWEYAARAGATTAWYCGANENCIDGAAWYRGNHEHGVQPVGQKEPNAWGLYDIMGNVWEWCWDWYDLGNHDSSPAVDPLGPSSGSYHVLRGGCWFSLSSHVRSATRSNDAPALTPGSDGLRLARTAP